MRLISFLLFILLSSALFAQGQKETKTLNTLHFIYGTKIFQSNFSPSYNKYNAININNAYKLVGIGFNGELLINRAYISISSLSFSKIIPEKILINDSLLLKNSGHLFSLTMFGLDLLKSTDKADIVVSLGFDSGRIKLTTDEGLKIRNGLFAPKISLQPRFRLAHKFVVGFNIDYSYDVSKSEWKRNDTSLAQIIPINNFRQSGIGAFFYIGYAHF